MATKGQTHQKRAREVARRERRELKQAKKEARAAGGAATEDDAGAPLAEGDSVTVSDGDPETAQGLGPVSSEQEG